MIKVCVNTETKDSFIITVEYRNWIMNVAKELPIHDVGLRRKKRGREGERMCAGKL